MPLTLVPPQPGRTPNYRIRGTYIGVRVDRSTETHDKATARRFLEGIKAAIERGAFAEPAPLTLAAAITSYVQAGGETRFLGPILKHFGRGATVRDIDQISADAAAVVLYPHGTPATRNRNFYTPLAAVLHHVGVDSKIRRPKGAAGQSRRIWLTAGQAGALLAAADAYDSEFGLLVATLLYTGLRLSEGLRIRRDDLDLENDRAWCGRTKNGDPRMVYLPPVLADRLAEHLQKSSRSDGRLFRWRKGGELYLLAGRIYAETGIDHGGAPFHVLRHTYGAMMTRLGADLVGTGAWKSATAARVYQHFEIATEARKAVDLPGASHVEIVQSAALSKRKKLPDG